MRTKLLIALALSFFSTPLLAADLSEQFARPPDSARPWVYWFWNNGNVTKAGITADFEAMKRAGIGGVIIMDVVERFAPPPGTADFMNAEWQELFCFAVSEAHRLGLEINMTNGPGWCSSSGQWITPELSMQMLVTMNFMVTGPVHLPMFYQSRTWTASGCRTPFRVNISDALKPGSNTLEICVADLWPNRMIGNAALPEAERFTWSSYEPFTKDSPLPQSGLLGPVTLQTAEPVYPIQTTK
jgi:hypothetical protein